MADGTEMEPVMCELYYDKMKNNHKTFTGNTTGLLTDEDHPILGASSDGIVTCSCHGTGLLEIKYTYKFRNETIQSIADQDYHIEKEEDNLYRLKRFSPWYTQIQMQMGYARYHIAISFCLLETNRSAQI